MITAAAAVIVASACSPISLAPEFDEQLNVCPVTDNNVTAVRLQPTTVDLRVGWTSQLRATPVDAQGQFVLCAPPITWSTTDSSVATVSNGLVTGVAAGTAFIRANAGARADSVRVTVVAASIGSISIERAPASLLVGQTAGLVLVTRDTDVATVRLIGHARIARYASRGSLRTSVLVHLGGQRSHVRNDRDQVLLRRSRRIR